MTPHESTTGPIMNRSGAAEQSFIIEKHPVKRLDHLILPDYVRVACQDLISEHNRAAVQETGAAHPGRVATLPAQGDRSKRSSRNRRGEIQEGIYDILLSVWRPRLAGKDRRPDPCRRHLRPHRSRFLQHRHRLQRIHAQAKRCQRKRSVRSLRLIGLCPNPRFNAFKVFREEWCCMSKQKKKSDPLPCPAYGITLPAKPHIGRSGRSSALPYPPIWLKAIIWYRSIILLSMYNLAVEGVQFRATTLFSLQRRGCSIHNGRGVQHRRRIQ